MSEDLQEFPLSPCAHCGGAAEMKKTDDGSRYKYAVYCKGLYCGICTPMCSTATWAMTYWNKRDWKRPDDYQPPTK